MNGADLRKQVDASNIYNFFSSHDKKRVVITHIKKETKKDCKKNHETVIIKNVVKSKQHNIPKTTKKDCKNNQEINLMKNYLMKKRI